tara:strand:- start:1921 stop:2727 length:807 start_codon:yes stop_codon:yes gene_type:complete
LKHRLGLFDSGVGGLTVLRRLLERHGKVPCVYLGDTARVPYGSRLPQEIKLIAKEVVQWLTDQQVTAVVMACNTTNALASDVAVEVAEGIPVVGLIEAAASMLSESRVGVLATPAAAASGAYRKQIEISRPGTVVVEQGCPDFVPLIEAGQFSSEELFQAACEYVKPLLDAQVEAVVLGCTHYPLLEPTLRQLLPKHVRLVDPAIGVARQLDELLGNPTIPVGATFSLASTRFCVTADPEGFATRATRWLGERPQVELVSLQNPACAS